MALKQKKFFDAPIYFSKHGWHDKVRFIGQYVIEQKSKIDDHKRVVIELNGKLSDIQFVIGDCLLEAEDSGIKVRELRKEAEEAFGGCYKWSTLKNIKSVCRAIEPSRRRDDLLSYSCHVEVAKLAPEMQDLILSQAIEEQQGRRKAFTVDDIRKLIHHEQRQQKLAQGRKELQGWDRMSLEEREAALEKEKKERYEASLDEKHVFKAQVQMTHRKAIYLFEIAKAKKLRWWKAGDPMPAFIWMAFQYMEENADRLKAEVEAFRAEEGRLEEARKASLADANAMPDDPDDLIEAVHHLKSEN